MKSFTVILSALAASASAQFCGVVTSAVQSYIPCSSTQYPAMDAACLAIGGTVAGHNQEIGDARSNCITYCNQVPTGGHDVTEAINSYTQYHLYVVDSCATCDYCGDI